MPEPKTPQQLNEAVAKKLGLDFHIDEWGYVLVLDRQADTKEHPPPHPLGEMEYICETKCYGVKFEPATDHAAALWALDRWCKGKGKAVALRRSNDKKPLWSCTFGWGEPWNSFYPNLCEAISEAIVGAANTERAERRNHAGTA